MADNAELNNSVTNNTTANNLLNTDSLNIDIPSEEYRYPSIERLRIVLMGMMCICLFGFPTKFGAVAETVCGFVPIAFYIISGYLVLREDKDRPARIKRTIKRTAVAFVIMAAVYFALAYFYYYRTQNIDILTYLPSKRFWFEFLFLNVWKFPLGNLIWFIQALLYAYIIIFVLEKLHLLKYDFVFILLLLAVTVVGGELTGLIKWNILGYTYIPGNFFTRALPYILLGEFIHRKKYVFAAFYRNLYYIGILFGVALTVVEVFLLGTLNADGYYGHLLGMGVTAFCVCMLAFQDDDFNNVGFEKKFCSSRRITNIMYYICQPVCILYETLVTKLFLSKGESTVVTILGFSGIFTIVACFIILRIIARLKTKKANLPEPGN